MGVGKLRDNLTRKEIAKRTAKELNLVYDDVLTVFNKAVSVLADEIGKGRNVELRDFGAFKIVETKPRKVRGVLDKENEYDIPSRLKVSFKPSKKLKQTLLGENNDENINQDDTNSAGQNN